jgi:RNA polymerase-binding transcription factor DksA
MSVFQLPYRNPGSGAKRPTVETLERKLDEAFTSHAERLQAPDEELDDVQMALVRRRQFALTEITAARERIKQGRYGICESCLGTITFTRLQALPYARLCFDCATLPVAVRHENHI